MTMDPDILQDYLPEARELLERAQEDTLRLEANPQDDALLASVFRAFHTLKGGAGFLEADALVDWTHHLEDLLDQLRCHALPVTPVTIDTILKGLDVISGMLQELAQGNYPHPGPADLGQRIRDLATGKDVPAAPAAPANVTHGPLTDSNVSEAPQGGTLQAWQRGTADGSRGVYVERAKDGQGETMDLASSLSTGGEAASDLITDAEFEQVLDALYGGKAPGVVPPAEARKEVSSGGDTTVRAEPAPAEAAPVSERSAPAVTERPNPGPEATETTLRVESTRLDAVMNQVGELVLLRNRFLSAMQAITGDHEDLARIAREMDLTVNDMQNTVMRLRMQPCKRLFQQLPRVVRDVSRQLGKRVNLQVVGEDVEIDKKVVDALSAPLVHLVRNSLDHGIELPADRAMLGKAETATLRIAAIHLGDKVRIEVSDDGRGIDAQKIQQKAMEKGLISPEDAARLTESEALELIFRPGFSTNDTVTEYSGRGVGMDVVKKTTQGLRGRLDVQTALGSGTTIAMEFPLTLAVLPVLYLRLRRDVYAVPISSVSSLLDVDPSRLHQVQGRALYRAGPGQIVPLVDLGAILHHRPMQLGMEPTDGILTERGLIVVSEVLGNEDSVVKPIDFLSESHWYQGATLSGKGEVVLILDIETLIRNQVELQRGAA
ncbi:chemotaxis protein CheA [Acidithiobacillus caldus]|uniref:Chemotaxis protein CheA n=1 Tax=Acidithiobacillus caldus (strain SM-1) TaxID=990288 RepID=F9ZPM5_ACICS|nr:chemotaxis protein CheA [Acidithiobacillus caldus]AEK56846.1 Signal transduction histidine kinase CheA [Acidithiobacillus caldus SM-1]